MNRSLSEGLTTAEASRRCWDKAAVTGSSAAVKCGPSTEAEDEDVFLFIVRLRLLHLRSRSTALREQNRFQILAIELRTRRGRAGCDRHEVNRLRIEPRACARRLRWSGLLRSREGCRKQQKNEESQALTFPASVSKSRPAETGLPLRIAAATPLRVRPIWNEAVMLRPGSSVSVSPDAGVKVVPVFAAVMPVIPWASNRLFRLRRSFDSPKCGK